MSKDSFIKARDDAYKSDLNVDEQQGFKLGADWAYEYMCNKDFQFSLHRSWVYKHDKLKAEAGELAEALDKFEHTIYSNGLSRESIIIAMACEQARIALKKYRGIE